MKNLHISLPSALFGAVIAFACTVGSGNDDTAIAQSGGDDTATAQSSGGGGRAVVTLYIDADNDRCEYVDYWAVNGGDCDCPSGFSTVGMTRQATGSEHTVCLEN